MKTKTRIYALYQFMSFFSIFLGLSGIGIYIYAFAKRELISYTFLNKILQDIFAFVFENQTQTFGASLLFIAIIIHILSWIVGWNIYRTNNRNYYDALFLLFLFIPLISNIFCLMAQLSLKVSVYKSSRITSIDLKKATSQVKKEIIKLQKGA